MDTSTWYVQLRKDEYTARPYGQLLINTNLTESWSTKVHIKLLTQVEVQTSFVKCAFMEEMSKHSRITSFPTDKRSIRVLAVCDLCVVCLDMKQVNSTILLLEHTSFR